MDRKARRTSRPGTHALMDVWSTASRPGPASRTGSGRSACSSCCSPACRSSTRIRRSISATSRASASTTRCSPCAARTRRRVRSAISACRGALRHNRRVRRLRADADRPVGRGFPAWATIPSGQDLATGRVVHFFFAWILSGTLLVWLLASLVNGHIRRDLAPRHRRPPPPAARCARPSEAEIPSHAATTTRCRNSPMPACCSSSCR